MKLRKLVSFMMALALTLAIFPAPSAKAASERLPDGSYLRIENGIPMFFGKVLLMEGGNTRVLSQYGGSVSPIM